MITTTTAADTKTSTSQAKTILTTPIPSEFRHNVIQSWMTAKNQLNNKNPIADREHFTLIDQKESSLSKRILQDSPKITLNPFIHHDQIRPNKILHKTQRKLPESNSLSPKVYHSWNQRLAVPYDKKIYSNSPQFNKKTLNEIIGVTNIQIFNITTHKTTTPQPSKSTHEWPDIEHRWAEVGSILNALWDTTKPLSTTDMVEVTTSNIIHTHQSIANTNISKQNKLSKERPSGTLQQHTIIEVNISKNRTQHREYSQQQKSPSVGIETHGHKQDLEVKGTTMITKKHRNITNQARIRPNYMLSSSNLYTPLMLNDTIKNKISDDSQVGKFSHQYTTPPQPKRLETNWYKEANGRPYLHRPLSDPAVHRRQEASRLMQTFNDAAHKSRLTDDTNKTHGPFNPMASLNNNYIWSKSSFYFKSRSNYTMHSNTCYCNFNA